MRWRGAAREHRLGEALTSASIRFSSFKCRYCLNVFMMTRAQYLTLRNRGSFCLHSRKRLLTESATLAKAALMLHFCSSRSLACCCARSRC